MIPVVAFTIPLAILMWVAIFTFSNRRWHVFGAAVVLVALQQLLRFL
jgi:hypothetical protein